MTIRVRVRIFLMMVLSVQHLTTACATPVTTVPPPQSDGPLQDFLAATERLVMTSIDRALNVTKAVYRDWRPRLTAELCGLACPLMIAYTDEVNRAQRENSSYMEKRKLFAHFRAINAKIATLQDQLKQEQQIQFSYPLISEEFYNQGRNTTEFDNLYMEFMQGFKVASETLWRSMSESTVEQQEELLEILDEISSEQELRERDKLYDEFIEMYLFKQNN